MLLASRDVAPRLEEAWSTTPEKETKGWLGRKGGRRSNRAKKKEIKVEAQLMSLQIMRQRAPTGKKGSRR